MRESKVTTRKLRKNSSGADKELSEVINLKNNNRDLAKALTEQKLIVKKLLREKNEADSKLLTLRVKYKELSNRFQTVVALFEDSFKSKSRAWSQVLRMKQVQLENDSQLGELTNVPNCASSKHSFVPERFKLNTSLETSQTPAKAVRPMVFGVTIERPTINLQRINFNRESISATEVMNETSQDRSMNITVNGEPPPALTASSPVVMLDTLPITQQTVQLQSVGETPAENEENEPPDNVDDREIIESHNFPSTSASTSAVGNFPYRPHLPSNFVPNRNVAFRNPIPTRLNLDDIDYSSDEENDTMRDLSMEVLCEEEQNMDDLDNTILNYRERSILNTLGEENEQGSPQMQSEEQNISLHEDVVSSATNPTNNTNPTVNMCPMESPVLSVAEEASSATPTTSPSEPTEEPSTSSLRGPISDSKNFVCKRKSKYKRPKKTKKSDTSENENQNETNKTVFSPKRLRKRKCGAYKEVPLNRKLRRS